MMMLLLYSRNLLCEVANRRTWYAVLRGVHMGAIVTLLDAWWRWRWFSFAGGDMSGGGGGGDWWAWWMVVVGGGRGSDM